MNDVMEQWRKTMEKMTAPWEKIMEESNWMKKMELPFHSNWSSWVAAMRSTHEVNVTWWQTFMDQGETVFFKMFKESPFYNSALESQIRDSWEGIRKATASQQQFVKEQFEKIEALLKEKEEPR